MQLAPNPSGWSKGQPEYRLDSLPVGSRFRCSFPHRVVTGVVADQFKGSVQVRLDGGSKQVTMTTADGEAVEFQSRKSNYTYWAGDCPVEYVGVDEKFLAQLQEEKDMPRGIKGSGKSKNGKAANSAQPAQAEQKTNGNGKANGETTSSIRHTDPKTKALLLRWRFAVQSLGELLKVDGPVEKSCSARDKVQSIYDEAVGQQVKLPAIQTYPDPVFQKMELAEVGPEGVGMIETRNEKENSNQEVDEDMKKAKAVKKGKAKAAKPRAEKKAKVAKKADNPCGCGCGALVAGKFKQGHDSTYKSRVLKVERGEMKPTDPEVRKMLGKDGEKIAFRELAKGGWSCTNSLTAK